LRIKDENVSNNNLIVSGMIKIKVQEFKYMNSCPLRGALSRTKKYFRGIHGGIV